MAVSWPFDSTVAQDAQGNPVYSRAYSSDVIAKILAKYFGNGVFGGDSACFQVVAADGMTVTVHPGYANINGRQVYEEADRALTVQAADAALDRIDSVVLRLNLTLSALAIDLYVVQGTAAAVPVAPELTRNASVWELGLANLFIAKSTTTISQERITDTRLDTDRCGVVASVIGDTDTTTYYAQIAADLAAFREGREADFDVWFASVQQALGTDAAGNLLNLINLYRAKTAQVTLAAADWTGGGPYTQVKSVSIVPANGALHAGPAEASREAYSDAGVRVSAASEGSVTFTATGLPTAALTVLLAAAETGSGGVAAFNAGVGKAGNTDSTVEHWTGDYWTDGRKIYEKTISGGALASGATYLTHGIANIGALRGVNANNSRIIDTGYVYQFPRYYPLSTNYICYCDNFNTTAFIVYCGPSTSITAYSFVLRYTCTDR